MSTDAVAPLTAVYAEDLHPGMEIWTGSRWMTVVTIERDLGCTTVTDRHGNRATWTPEVPIPARATTDPATWTAPDGTVFDLTRPIQGFAAGDYWHHIGWLTPDDQPPMPLVAWSLSPDRATISRRWADIAPLPSVMDEDGPLSQPDAVAEP